MTDTPKRFDEWEEVDCNECARYWDSSCDGAARDSHKQCNSFMATRSIILPEKIKRLEQTVDCIVAIGFVLVAVFGAMWAIHIFGG